MKRYFSALFFTLLILIMINHLVTTRSLAEPANPALAQVTESERSSIMTDNEFGEVVDNDSLRGGENVEVIGHISGRTDAVFVAGNYAYIGEGPALTILDITNPASPTVVGKTAPMPDIVKDIYVSGNYAYIAVHTAGLRVVDISTPTSPTEVGFYDSPGFALGIYLSGNYAYLASSGLRVVDISTPTSPTEVGFYDSPGVAYGVTVSGNYAYVANGDEGLRVVDISTPTSPTEVGFYDSLGDGRGVYLSGNYAYLADGSGGLRVVDISTPTNPTEVGFYDSSGYVYGVTVSGNYAYLADGSAGLRVVDISTASPTEVGFYDSPGNAMNVTVSDNYAYLADWDAGLVVVDISTPTSPTPRDSLLGDVFGVTVSGNYAYLAAGYQGLRIVDISTPSSPTEVGFYDSPGIARGVYLSGNYAYLADGYEGLRVVDISTPTSPTEVGFYDTPGSVGDVYVSGNYAYLADDFSVNGSHRFVVVDISTPSNPTEVGFYNSPGTLGIQSVYVSGDYAYLADGSSGLRVVSISQPTSPTSVGFYDSPGYANGVYVSGNYAYLADDVAGLRVVSISEPNSPTEVGFYDSPGAVKGVTISGNYAYLADSNRGLRVVDISTPTNPTSVGFYDSPGRARGVTVSGNYAYLADGDGGLLILQFTALSTPTPTPTNTPIATSTYTPTPSLPTGTPTNAPTGTPTRTPTNPPIATPTPALDVYEPNDTCEQAESIPTDGTVQHHTFHSASDADWVSFEGVAGTEYLIEALTPASSQADVLLELYGECDSLPTDGQDYAFSPDVRLRFVAPTSGMYHLKLANDNLEGAALATYDLSVRALADEATPGALILVAGRLRSTDPLQDNIHHVTNSVYQTFLANGYTGENIYYLATEPIDVDNDGTNDVDASPNDQNLSLAITEWAADKVGPNRALTLYLMDHGTYDRLYLNGPSETVTPSEIDGWLDELEAAAAGVRVNVVVEACHSGSFIELSESISQAGRVIITSTGTHPVAYASEEGAIFSDAFVDAVGRGMSLYGAFSEAKAVVQVAHPDQTVWLDDNGDGLPNRDDDGALAQRRGFAYAGTLSDILWPPYIVNVEVGEVTNEEGIIRAEVRDNKGIVSVWADIYKPSYTPPDNSAEEMPQEVLPSIRLSDQDGDGYYDGLYENFDETGTYRIVVYATDVENLAGEPISIAVQVGTEQRLLYLPSIMR